MSREPALRLAVVAAMLFASTWSAVAQPTPAEPSDPPPAQETPQAKDAKEQPEPKPAAEKPAPASEKKEEPEPEAPKVPALSPPKPTTKNDAEPKEPKPAELGKRSEHIVYVPYSKLEEVFENDKGNVLLSFEEYQRLWNAVRALQPSTAKPPVPAILTRVEYDGRAETDSVRLTARLLVDSLVEDWVKLPVKFPDAAVASVEGATLAAQQPGEYLLIVHGKRLHEVTLQLSVPLTDTPEGKALTLRGPVAASTQLKLTLPGKDLAVEVTPKLATTKIDRDESTATVTTILGAVDAVTVSWKDRKDEEPAESLAVAQSETAVTVGDGIVHSQTQLQYRMLRGETAEIRFSLPAGQKLLDVQGAGVRDWKQTADQDRNLFAVRLYSPLKDAAQLRIDAEQPLPEGPFEVKIPTPIDAQRHTGTIAVASSPDLSVTVVQRQELLRVSPSEVSENLRRSEGLYFRFYSPDPVLTLQAAPVSPRINVQAKTLYRLEANRLRGQSSFQYDVQRAGIFSVALTLPAGVKVDGVSASSFDRYELRQQGDVQLIDVRLGKQVLGALTVQLDWSLAIPEDVTELSLPIPAPLDVETERGFGAFLVHESFEVTQDDGKSQGVRPASPDDLVREQFSVPATSTMRLAAAFQYQNRPVAAVYSVRRRDSRIVAESFTHVEVKENAAITETTILYDVRYAAASSFQLLVPEAIADKVEITGPAIKERNRGQAADGMVPWTVVLHTDTLGKHAVKVSYSQPIELGNAGTATAEVPLQLVQPANVERETGQIAVTKDRNLALEDEVEAAEPIDPRLLAAPSEVNFNAVNDVQLAYRFYRRPVNVTLTVTRHEVQRVVETVVTRALIETVIPEEGSVTYRARYRIKSSQRQRLKIAMPSGARFLGVSVAGRSVLPEKSPEAAALAGREEYLVNVSRSTGAEEPFDMVMLYELESAAPQLKSLTFQPLQMPKLFLEMPLFVGDVAYQRLFWQVWLPRRYTSLARPPGFTDENQSMLALLAGVGHSRTYIPEVEQWDREWQQESSRNVFEFATVGRKYTFSSLTVQPSLTLTYGHIPSMMLVASAAVFVLMLMMTPLRLGGKLTLLTFLFFCGVLGSLYEPESVHRWAAAAHFGLLFGLTIWAIQGFVHLKQSLAGWRSCATHPEREPQPQSEFDLSRASVAEASASAPSSHENDPKPAPGEEKPAGSEEDRKSTEGGSGDDN